MAEKCDACNGTAVLMKADFSSFVACPECTTGATKNGGV